MFFGVNSLSMLQKWHKNVELLLELEQYYHQSKMVGKKITVTNMIFNGFNLDSKITFYLSFTRNRKGGKFVWNFFIKKQYLEAEAGL